MEPHFEQGRIRIYLGNALKVLGQLPSESIHCVVTSPPYWGLRDYGTADWDGGDPQCTHKPSEESKISRNVISSTLGGGKDNQKNSLRISDGPMDKCLKCGATRIDDQIGIERTPEEYIEKLVAVFREVKRVLRKDGTLWINIGDSYARMQEGNVPQTKNKECMPPAMTGRIKNAGMKAKDLVGIPWMLAFALRADGWYLRQDIIWSKPNPMPESVEDRCTKAHEYLFLLSKSSRYYYDKEAIAEKAVNVGKTITLGEKSMSKGSANGANVAASGNGKAESYTVVETRNKRSVWEVTTEPFPEAHFATFPTALVRPCILAGTSEKGCCPECGAPWEREVDRVPATSKECPKTAASHEARGGTGIPVGTVGKSGSGRINGYVTTIGWFPSCSCNNEDGPELNPSPCTVLDPFSGSATTGLVARDNGCRYIGIELNPEYIEISARRLAQEVMRFS